MKFFLPLLLLLVLPAAGQRAVKPIRVALTTTEKDGNSQELNRLVRERLQRDIILSANGWNFEVSVAAAALTPDNACRGYGASMVVVNEADPKNRHHSHFIGGDLNAVAEQIAWRLNKEFFAKRR